MKTFAPGETLAPYQCPVTATMRLIGGKWKMIILWCITNEVNRFGELQRAIPAITKKVLTEELRALESDGLITRTVYPGLPLKVEYHITSLGETLRPMLNSMANWGEQYAIPTQASATVGD